MKLKMIVDMLESTPDEEFNINHWWLEDGVSWDPCRNTTKRVANGQCGCAIGHAINKGILPESVIRMDHENFEYEYEMRDNVFDKIAHELEIYDGVIAKFLFSQYSYRGIVTKQRVIDRINFVLKDWKAGQTIPG